MRTNYSSQTYDTLLLEYECKVESLLKKINQLQNQLNYERKNTQPSGSNKDQLIIRQSMVKAACDFHASRPQSDIVTVIKDAEKLIEFINK